MNPSLVLWINGQRCETFSAPNARLSTVLRDEFALTGTKIGCEAGDCGACTVLVNGQAKCACITPLAQCESTSVTTVEGLALQHANGSSLNRLQEAFLQAGAAQCGICTPGMLMAATELLDTHERRGVPPNRQDVLTALSGVLCRCTGYQTIVEAVLSASQTHVSSVALPRQFDVSVSEPVVGARWPRIEGASKLKGQYHFGADEYPADCLAVRVVRSPYARAQFDLAALKMWAETRELAVVSASDVPFNGFAIFADLRDQPVFADAQTRFLGEAVAALVGEPERLQDLDLSTLPISFLSLPAVLDIEESLQAAQQGINVLHASRPDNILCHGRVFKNEIDADDVNQTSKNHSFIEVNALTSYVEHAYIEPEAGYVQWEGKDIQSGRLEIVACTQTPYMDRDEVAHVLQWSAERIHIRPSGIGGGFGGKLDLSVQPILAVAALALAKRAATAEGSKFAWRPLRLVYDRRESMQASTKRHPAKMTAKLSHDAHGNLIAYEFQGDFNTGAYASWGPTVANRVPIHASGPYRIPRVLASTRAIYTNNSVAGAFRGFGVPQSTLLIEEALDKLAQKLGMDRLELRYQNAIRTGDCTATGQVLASSVGLLECLARLRPRWTQWRDEVAAFNTDAVVHASPLRRGRGIATMWYGIGNTVIANPSTMRIAELGGGRYRLFNGAQEIGQGSYTIMVQIAAQVLGVSPSVFEQVHGDTDLTPDAGKSSASRQTFVSGTAVANAAMDLLQKMQRRDQFQGNQNNSKELLVGEGYFNPPTIPLDADGQGVPYACYGFAAQSALVEVDIELGTVKVLCIDAAHDVGKAINPTLVEGQIHGGIAQGLGLALMEEYVAGRTDNLHDYLIPTVGDMPVIHCHLVEDPEPLGPFGAKGVGEPALVATAPAILSAIEDACGVRPNHLPVTPSRLWALLAEKERAAHV